MANLKRWTIHDSLELYNIQGWGRGCFGVNEKGHMVAYPKDDPALEIDLKELVDQTTEEGVSLPLLIRFSDILAGRLAHLNQCFSDAIEKENYQGRHFTVYPIKVNQQRQVVEEIVRFGAEHHIGLEAGSKPELHGVLAMQDKPDALIICNGYKDAAYIRLALQAQKLGKQVFLVAEKLAELKTILALAREENIRPLIGLRIKLINTGSGKWEDSGGDYSKFGLTVSEVVEAVELMAQGGYLDCFQLIHFHLGSQLTNIRRIKEALREMARYYSELWKLGCRVDYVDVGGGLGVDYQGTKSTHDFSINYTEEEYAKDVVGALTEICHSENLEHPHIITESGRALTAHHSMLVVNVLETSGLSPNPVALASTQAAPAPGPDTNTETIPGKMSALAARLNQRNHTECWHEALHLRDEAHQLFDLGFLSLQDRGHSERTFWAIATRVKTMMKREKKVSEELEPLESLLADKYFCNFSIFQSLPDAWAIGHEFPIVPLHRLKEKPTRNGILQDLTCDSDGKIISYVGSFESENTLPLHDFDPDEPYYLGVFLIGAYQEILGDLHNLFGDTNAIHVTLDEEGTPRVEQIIHGENIAQVLSYVQYPKGMLIDRMERQIQGSLQAGRMTAREARIFRELYQQGLDGNTYLESPKQSRQTAKSQSSKKAG